MLNCILHTRKTKLVGYHYTLESLKDYRALEDILKYRRLGENWRICILDWPLKDLRTVMEESFPETTQVDICMPPDIFEKFAQEFVKEMPKRKSAYEEYLDVLATSPLRLDKRASQELFKRCRGKADDIEKALEELLLNFPDIETITVQQLNTVLIKEEVIYGSDIVLLLLCKRNPRVPKRGSKLSKYKYGSYWADLQALIDSVGKNKAFYFIRKALRDLYEDKLSFLRSQEVERFQYKEAVKVIDMYTIMHAYFTFLNSNPMMLEGCIAIIEERMKGNDYFKEAFLTD